MDFINSQAPSTSTVLDRVRRPISRRGFLKGVLAASAVAAVTTAPAFLASRASAAPALQQIAQAQYFATSSPFLRQALRDLRALGFPMHLNQSSTLVMPSRPELMAILFHDTRLGTFADGADLAFTINLHEPAHAALHYIIGRSHPAELEVTSVVARADGNRTEETFHIQRSPAALQSCVAAAPMSSVHLTALAVPESTTRTDGTPWHYQHASNLSWMVAPVTAKLRDFQLRFTQCIEQRAYRPCGSTPTYRQAWQGFRHTAQLPA